VVGGRVNDDVLTEVIGASPFAWFVFDAAHQPVFENARASEIAGWPTTGREAIGPKVRDVIDATVRRARSEAGSASADTTASDAGDIRSLRVEAHQLVLDRGLASVAWVVELDQAVESLQEARQRLDELLDHLDRYTAERERLVGVIEAVVSGLDAGLVVVDRKLVVSDCSDRAAALLRVSRADVVGRALSHAGPAGAELVALISGCFDSRPSHGRLEQVDPAVNASCASFDAGAAAVAVLQLA
jgi:PAS domain-containing protein